MAGRRSLTAPELLVLRLVQELHGAHNTEAEAFFTDADEACIAATNVAAEPVVFVSLTNLGTWHAAGELSDEDMRAWIAPGRATG
jgi:hypothetical protein